jgi:SAM-dependent methyltransferase
LLNPQPGERILDLGCGDGRLTEKLVQMGCEVVGVDGSAAQIAAAQAKGLTAVVMDGQQLTFENEFDAVFSNAALHWMNRPDDVIAGVKWALRRDGRFVGEMGGHSNVAVIRTALHEALRQRGIERTLAERLGCCYQSVARWEQDRNEPGPRRWPGLEAVLGPGLVPSPSDLVGSILAARLRLGLTQVEMARRAGVAPRTVRNCERGVRAPRRETLRKLWTAVEGTRGARSFDLRVRRLASEFASCRQLPVGGSGSRPATPARSRPAREGRRTAAFD